MSLVVTRREDPTDVVGSYLDDLGQYRLLTADEEISLARRVQAGDQQAREIMARHNLGLVINIAKGFRKSSVPFPDLIQEGNLGLMRAIDGFDPERGNRFSTYATLWIRKCIYAAIANTALTIRIPAGVFSAQRRIERLAEEFREEQGREPEDAEIVPIFGKRISAERIGELRRGKLPMAYSMQEALPLEYLGDTDATRERFLSDDAVDIEEEAIAGDTSATVRWALSQIDEQQARALRLRFGIDTSEPPYTYKELARYLGVSMGKATELCTEASAALREILEPLELDVA